MLAVIGATANATVFTVEEIEYEVTDNEAKAVEVNKDYSSATSITIPESVTYDNVTYTVTAIGSRAFTSSTQLKTINLPNTLKQIGEYAFKGCTSLLSIEIPDSVSTLGNSVFNACESLVSVKLPDSLRAIPDLAFDNCHALSEINFPETLEQIGSKSFYRTKLKSVIIPEKVTTIEAYTFCNCADLVSVKLPANLTTIFDRGFAATAIEEISLPNSIKTLDVYAFNACRKLRSVYIPEGVTSISDYAFQACDSLHEFHIRRVSPLSITDDVFGAPNVRTPIDTQVTLFVPNGSLDAYKNANVWSSFANIVEEGISISISEMPIIAAGATAVMPLNVTPKTVYFDSTAWTSSNENVATIDNQGAVTALSEGSSTISFTATIGETSYTAQREITVVDTKKNRFTVNDTVGFNTLVTNLPVYMTNEKNITAFQCDIYLPEGLEIPTADGEYDITFAGRETRTHSISAEAQADGAIRIAAFSSKNAAFTGSDGVLFNIPVLVNAEPQVLTLSMKNIILVDDNNAEIPCDDLEWSMTVKSFITGDANTDEKVTVADATTTVSYILGETPANFLVAAADITGDGNITINDVTGIIDIVLGTSSSTTPATQAKSINITTKESAPDSDYLYINETTIAANETKDIEICLKNSTAYTAFQCDIYLPEGLTFLEEDGEYIVDLSDRKARTHTIATKLQEDGSLRVVAFSSKNANFSENDGALMIVPVVAAENLTAEPIEMKIKNNLFVSESNVEYTLPDVTATINSPSSTASIESITDTQIWSEGNTLHIISDIAGKMNLYSIDGRATTLTVEAGHNTYDIENSGIYIINGNKIAIR